MSPPRVTVRVGDLALHGAPAVLVTIGLGSCVAVILHDATTGVGGLAHVLLPVPSAGRTAKPPGRFAISAVPTMLDGMVGLGAVRGRVQARLVGGAAMFASLAAPGTIQVGERNILAARAALQEAGVPLVGEAVGGDYGRSVEFNLQDGGVLVTSYAHDPEQL